ncbi:MAG: hypothetical protein A2W80_16325 [Candidatus Riflebacteria bacterium GWC2_50_8]|nr:MAG: hypothetical protein A2W80_16325 [Candidatus Riflebacteria bacterium GWC2_50_8]
MIFQDPLAGHASLVLIVYQDLPESLMFLNFHLNTPVAGVFYLKKLYHKAYGKLPDTFFKILCDSLVEKENYMTEESIAVWQHGGKVILRQTLVEDGLDMSTEVEIYPEHVTWLRETLALCTDKRHDAS